MHKTLLLLCIITLLLTIGCRAGGETGGDTRADAMPSSSGDAGGTGHLADSLRSEILALAGQAPYIVIDRSRNRLFLRDNTRVLLDASCATGSGMILYGDKENQTWHFQTPRGVFSVQKKVTDPIWKKPMWAFVEKNEKAPVLPWEFNRLDGTTLGRFALELQDSYAIHGTLYPNLLGRSITHGCIRLNDPDLAEAYNQAHVGTRVFVF